MIMYVVPQYLHFAAQPYIVPPTSLLCGTQMYRTQCRSLLCTIHHVQHCKMGRGVGGT